jgi:hypothetical protein
MKSSQLGKSPSEIEVTNISGHGIWLYSNGTEYFLPYDQYPWFKDKTVSQITNVEESSPGHYYWPDLEVDLSESILKTQTPTLSKQNPHNKSHHATRTSHFSVPQNALCGSHVAGVSCLCLLPWYYFKPCDCIAVQF